MKNQPVCHVCTAGQTRIMAPLQSEIDGQDYQAVKCYACGLIFAHPIPNLSFDDLQAVYNDEYTESQPGISPVENQVLDILREATHRQMAIVEQYIQLGFERGRDESGY